MDFTYYTWNNPQEQKGRKTSEQIKLLNDTSNKIITNSRMMEYTFTNGMTRQYIWIQNRKCVGAKHDLHKNRIKTLVTSSSRKNDDYGFIPYPNDKKFYKYRLALLETRYLDKTKSKVVESYIVKNVNDIKYNQCYTQDMILICEEWITWGMFEILLDNGLRNEIEYNDIPRKDSYLKLTEFQNRSPNNPFDDPYEAKLKQMRDERNLFTKQIQTYRV